MESQIHDLDAWLATLPPPEDSEDGAEVAAGPIYLRRWLASDGPAPGPGVALLSEDGEPPRWAPLAAGEGVEDTAEAAAAFAFAAALYEARGGSAVAAVAPGAFVAAGAVAPLDGAASDDAWFAANPGRSCRIRPRAETDPPHYRADDGARYLTVVRSMGGLTPLARSIVALDALGGVMPADTDEGAFAALKADRSWVAAGSARPPVG